MSFRTLVTVKNLSFSIFDRLLFRDLDLSIGRGQVVAVTGRNGSGKTLLLQKLAGRELDRDVAVSGNVHRNADVTTAYLPQQITSADVEEQRSMLTAAAGDDFARLSHAFRLPDEQIDPSTASEGQLQKLALVMLLALEADLYLLDEPTNYLDIAGLTALEVELERLKDQGCGILIVTHDRALTDNLADETMLIGADAVYRVAGGGTAARFAREHDRESRSRQSEAIRKKIAALQNDFRAKTQWAAASEGRKRGAGMSKPYFAKLSKKMAKRAKVMQRRVEQEQARLEETRPWVPKELNLRMPRYAIRSRRVVSLESVSFSYDPGSRATVQTELLSHVTFAVGTRDKICIMGANGTGKTTLLRLIQGQLAPKSGVLQRNESVNLAVIPQGLSEFFTRPRLLDNFADCGTDETDVRRFLGAALLRRDKVLDPLENFSRGELMRAAVVKCLLLRAEFLLLDEPTSHLDIESIEVLEQLLGDFHGGMLVISHDRAFVSRVAETLYILQEGRLKLC